MAYLITGGMGYIGSRVLRDLLKAGREVVCLDPAGITPEAKEVIGEELSRKVEVVRGDVSDTIQFFRLVRERRVEVIIHHAFAMARNDHYSELIGEEQFANALRVNCGGMINVLRQLIFSA